MLASLFSKTRPFNYIITGIFFSIAFFLYQLALGNVFSSLSGMGQNALVFLVLVASFLLVNFISLRNALTKKDNYAVLLYLLLVLLFPTIFLKTKLIVANFFILLALRRLVSLKTLNAPKEKIFDASFWIFLATLFHFWSIIFILLVFISIVLHTGKDYKNWLIPFVSCFCVWVLYVFFSLFFSGKYELNFQEMMQLDFNFSVVKTTMERMSLGVYVSISFLFFVSQIIDYQNKPLNMQTSFKQIYFAFLLSIVVYVLSAHKTNDLLVFSFAPLAILGANMFEKMERYVLKEISLYLLVLISAVIFVLQL